MLPLTLPLFQVACDHPLRDAISARIVNYSWDLKHLDTSRSHPSGNLAVTTTRDQACFAFGIEN